MEYEGTEKRACKRFEIPGATVNYESEAHNGEFCPLSDLSRGGLMFLAKRALDVNAEVSLKISIPGERIPLTLTGKVRWVAVVEENKYKIGIQFNPYGEKKEQNYPGNLVKIIALEQKFSTPEKPDTEKYEIDG